MKISEVFKELPKALFKIQNELTSVGANKEGYNYNYADLEKIHSALIEFLKDNNILVIQATEEGSLVTRVIHVESGEWIESSIGLVLGKQDMQALGSAITYARRYALVCMFGLIVADDDGASTVSREVVNKKIDDYTASPVVGKPITADAGAYIVTFGKHKGKNIADNEREIGNYVEYLEKSAKTSGKPLSGGARELVDNYLAYIRGNVENSPVPAEANAEGFDDFFA
jgi:hypothetical protein